MLFIDNLTKSFGKTDALKGVTLALSLNEIVALVGPSGCGKTTLLRIVAGFEMPDGGKVVIDGSEAGSSTKSIAPSMRGLSLVFQELALWPHMTVRKHIEFVLSRNNRSGNDVKSYIDGILKGVNLMGYDKRYPYELSGGERQRLAIARALAPRPKYLLMDEPFSNLDPLLKEELYDLVINLTIVHGMGIMYVTHNIDEAFMIADRIAVMDKGVIEQVDNKEDIINNPKNEFVSRFLKLSRYDILTQISFEGEKTLKL